MINFFKKLFLGNNFIYPKVYCEICGCLNRGWKYNDEETKKEILAEDGWAYIKRNNKYYCYNHSIILGFSKNKLKVTLV